MLRHLSSLWLLAIDLNSIRFTLTSFAFALFNQSFIWLLRRINASVELIPLSSVVTSSPSAADWLTMCLFLPAASLSAIFITITFH